MEIKYNEATPQRPNGDRMIDAPMVTIDLPKLMVQIKDEQPWKDNDRNAITIFKTDGLRMVLIALHKDAEMVRHTAPGAINVQVLKGCIKFDTAQHCYELREGQMVVLHERIPHSVFAKEESIFLLTITTAWRQK